MAYDKLSGYVLVSKNDGALKNDKAPQLKGFISISPELLEALKQTTPDKFGNYKLELALWRKESRLQGSAKLPYVKPSQKPAVMDDNDTDIEF